MPPLARQGGAWIWPAKFLAERIIDQSSALIADPGRAGAGRLQKPIA
jgi:hypothetical protein